jgi:hypothetical protein
LFSPIILIEHHFPSLTSKGRLASSIKNEAVGRKGVETQGRKDVRKECPLEFCSARRIFRSGPWGKIRDILIILKVIWDFLKPYLPI